MGKREEMPDTFPSIVTKVCEGNAEAYTISGFYPDGRLGHVQPKGLKFGSDVGELLQHIGMTTSISLQSGVPWSELRKPFHRDRTSNMGRLLSRIGRAVSAAVEDRKGK